MTRPGTRRKAPVPKPPRPQRWATHVQSREVQFEMKRQAVLRSAGRAMAQKGFAAISLDELARSLNVTKPALYYYFKSKHEILFECHKLAFELGERCRDRALAAGGNGLGKLLNYMRFYIEGLVDELGGGSALTEYHHLMPAQQKELQPLRDEFDRFYRQLVSEGMADGSIRACDAKMAIFFINGAVRGIHRWYDPDGPLSGAEIATAFVDMIEHALRAPA